MEIFKDMETRHPGGSTGGGDDDIRVSLNDSTALGGTRRFVSAKNVNFSLFLRPEIGKDTGGKRVGLIQKALDVTKETGSKVDPKFNEGEGKNMYRDEDPGPHEGLLGSFSTMEEKRTRCRRETCDLQVPALSASSQGASNNPRVTRKRRYEDWHSSSQSDSDSEDSGRMGRSSRTKERWSSGYERVRRRRVSKKLRALQELLPNCDEVDTVAVLDEAIKYLKTLQQQVMFQVLSSRSPMYMPPPMMMPAAINQMYSPYLNQFPAVNVPRGMNIGGGVGCGGLQFPITHGPRTTVAVGNTMQMLDLQSIARMSHFFPSFGQPSMADLPTQAPSTDSVNLLNDSTRSGSRD